MPPFAEKESSLLAKLKKDKPRVDELEQQAVEKKSRPTAVMNNTSVSLPLVITCCRWGSIHPDLYRFNQFIDTTDS